MSEGRSQCGRLDLDDCLDDIFQRLWNRQKKRAKCRAILKKIQTEMLARHPKSRNEPLEKRFLELKRIFRLTDLEYDILLVAYVVEETCFNWPRRIEDREKPLYFAMALDRSYGEVLKAMTPKGALRKFELLDDVGKKSFFERMFNAKLTDAEFAELKTLGNLAPGDFRTVRQEQFYLASTPSNLDRIEALREECKVKKDGHRPSRIGFAA